MSLWYNFKVLEILSISHERVKDRHFFYLFRRHFVARQEASNLQNQEVVDIFIQKLADFRLNWEILKSRKKNGTRTISVIIQSVNGRL